MRRILLTGLVYLAGQHAVAQDVSETVNVFFYQICVPIRTLGGGNPPSTNIFFDVLNFFPSDAR